MTRPSPPSDGTAPNGYVLDSAWHSERARLASVTGLYDPVTLRLFRQLQLAAGWDCLEIGAGTGTVAEHLAAEVAPTGSVLALDIDTRFLDPLATESLRVEQCDITTADLGLDRYDLIHARLVLEHIAARDEVLARLVSALKPGGWLLVEDVDWATAGVTDPPSEVHASVIDACLTFFEDQTYEPFYARTLPRIFLEAGLTDVDTHAELTPVRSDPVLGVPQWDLFVDQLAPGLLAQGLLEQHQLDEFHRLWHDGRTTSFGPIMLSTRGRRPRPLPHD